jgi:hypothetical protein
LSRNAFDAWEDTGIVCAECFGDDCPYRASWLAFDYDGDGSTNLLQIDPMLPEAPSDGSAPVVATNTRYLALIFDDVSPTPSLRETGLPPDLFQRYNLGISGLGADKVMDLNDDGLPDLLRYVPYAVQAIFPDQPSGYGDWTTFWREEFYAACDPDEGGDFFDGYAQIFLNDGDGFWPEGFMHTYSRRDAVCRQFSKSTPFDLNSDGRSDLFIIPTSCDYDSFDVILSIPEYFKPRGPLRRRVHGARRSAVAHG